MNVFPFPVCLGFYLQTSEVQAYIGESVILACNGSGFPDEELQVYWEAMGKDVISLQGDVVTVGRGFEDRVNFLSDPTESMDFSLILSDLMLNDGEIYESPEFFTDYVDAFEGDDVTLECFGNIPKNKPWEDIYIQWLKDDREILRLSSGKVEVSIDYSILKLPAKHDISRGIFSLSITSVSIFDQGVYQCRYKGIDFEAPRSGFPETYMLTVWAVFSEVRSSTASLSSSSALSHTDTSSSVPVWTSVSSAQTESVSSVPAHTYSYAGSSQTQSSSSVPTLTYAERAEVTADPSVTDTDADSVVFILFCFSFSTLTDPSVTETGADSALFLVATDTSVTETHTDSDPSVTETGADSALFLVATDSSVTETHTDSALFLAADPSVTETTTDSALFLVATDTSVTETNSVTTDTSVTETATDSVLFLATTDPSVTETHTDSVMTDSSVPETGPVSGHRDLQEFLSDEIPWIRIGLISGVLLVTAVVLGLLLIAGRV
ncbi:Programmed cell death 1 ligand 1 [Labeo rohita]|uniref:Programmed cell death 1 ligand 1 n=1 Tax=Labeo rohita TaxID=84645 RepID=A0ABQ8N136_LABRO|nr:Programmed cell death 1 ligand 1 [Labeo rohita]